jgi:hypothetical protein
LAERSIYKVDPLSDPRWQEFLSVHPRASVFHTPAWLEALRRTYGYQPMVLTTNPPETGLTNGLVLCRIDSWLTGRRLVSVPFSDHCEPLVEDEAQLHSLVSALKTELNASGSKYLELRPVTPPEAGPMYLQEADAFCLHRLDLAPSLDQLFREFHKDCVQRRIRRAERAGLTCRVGPPETQLREFYRLVLLTRRRQNVPPQPFAWFRNLVQCMGDKLQILLALDHGRAVAGILTLRHNRVLFYKYGCSDKLFGNLGGMHLLLWSLIQHAKNAGFAELDLGRTDLDNPGLLTFKDRWGAQRALLQYLRYPHSQARHSILVWRRCAQQLLAHAPDAVLAAAGRMLYREIA